jgi:hypothetical protein
MNSPVSYCKEVNDKHLKLINDEVRSSFTRIEILVMEDFEDFWGEVDQQNGYEENWETDKAFYKPFYESVYHDILKGK